LLEEFETVDQNDDGLLSLAELSIRFPGFTQDRFDQLDADGDGFVSEAELEAVAAPGGCAGPGSIIELFLFGIAAFFFEMWNRISQIPHWIRIWIGWDDYEF
jgi:hypothetical protein